MGMYRSLEIDDRDNGLMILATGDHMTLAQMPVALIKNTYLKF